MGTSWIRAIFFVSLILLIGYCYLAWSLVRPMHLPETGEILAYLTLAAPFLMILWMPIFYWRRSRNAALGQSYRRIINTSYFSLAILSLLFTATVFRDVLNLIASNVPALLGSRQLASSHGAMSTLVIVGLCTLGLLFGYYEASRTPRIRNVIVPVQGLGTDWKPLRIVQLSDLHIGQQVEEKAIRRIVAKVNALKPDFIAITGDMVDGHPEALKKDTAPLKELSSKYGSFFVTGNHEYYWGGDAWIAEAKNLGFIPLINSHRIITNGEKRILVAGVPDLAGESFEPVITADPKVALEGSPSPDLKILLAHRPQVALEAEPLGYHLQLSGHTHGGQFIPWTFFIRFFHPFWKGLNRHGKLWVYVSQGTGTWGPPVRLGAPAEITLLEIKAA